jgi:hypothetical protein
MGLVALVSPAGFNDFEGIGKMKYRITVLRPIASAAASDA